MGGGRLRAVYRSAQPPSLRRGSLPRSGRHRRSFPETCRWQ